MTKRFDILIVGSGLGGLLCGAILSRQGYTVGVLEQHHQIGGNLQTFQRKGKRFDTGMHYIGCMEKGQILHKLLSYLEIVEGLELTRLDQDGFDHLWIGEQEFKYPQGFDAFEAALVESFPAEQKAIRAYVEKLQTIWDENNLLNLRPVSTVDLSKFDMYTEKVGDFVNRLTENEMLRAVLTGTNGLYAGQPDKTPLYVHAVINNFFIRSAWRLSSGSDFAALLKEKIEDGGGTVLCRQRVTGFEYEGKQITAAVTASGERFLAQQVISNIHPAATVDLLEEGKLRRAYTERIKSLENSIAPFSLYIILRPGTMPHFNHNIYYNSSTDVWGACATQPENWPTGGMLYTTEDPANPGFAESVTAITYMKYEEVKEWEHTAIGRRGQMYELFKQEKAELFLTMLEKVLPGLRDKLDCFFTSSPLTYRDYTATVNGSMYGIVKDANDPLKTFISAKTRIPNLYLTGQNLMTHGMLGTSMSALLTCAYFVDINDLIRDIREVY